jgi:hypothetical protein
VKDNSCMEYVIHGKIQMTGKNVGLFEKDKNCNK